MFVSTRACAEQYIRVSEQELVCHVCLQDVFGLHLEVSVFQEPALNMCVSFYKSFELHLHGYISLRETVLTCMYMCFYAQMDLSVYKSLCCTCMQC